VILTIRNLTPADHGVSNAQAMNVITVRRKIRPKPKKISTTRRSFRELTRGYFAGEARWQFAIEALLFAIIVAISAWPLFKAADALNEFLQCTPT
jgi:hypothetical protein